MTPLLAGKSRKMHDLYWYWSRNRAVRQGDMKLVWDNSVRVWELYDIAHNRCEANDLAGTQPERVKRMADDWFAWAKEMELKINSDSSDAKKKKKH
jgi:hypothetical protein